MREFENQHFSREALDALAFHGKLSNCLFKHCTFDAADNDKHEPLVFTNCTFRQCELNGGTTLRCRFTDSPKKVEDIKGSTLNNVSVIDSTLIKCDINGGNLYRVSADYCTLAAS